MEAREFSTGTSYATGDLCIYGGALYRFTAAHSAGAWIGTDAVHVDDGTQQMLTRIMTDYDNMASAVSFANRIVFSPSQIEGTRYKYTLLS